ncbi:MAG: hypothetical protein ACOH1Y_06965 [Propionicimonas sp.]
MVGNVYGADVVELRALSERMSRSAADLDRIVNLLTHQITATTAWAGPTAQRFRGDWSGSHRAAVASSARALRDCAAALRRNADEQAAASAAFGGQLSSVAGSNRDAGSSHESPPANVKGIIATLHEMKPDDGIRIQQVLGDDGVTRYVVYINGTDSSADKSLNSWGEAYFSWKGQEGHTDDYLSMLLAKRIKPANAEIMVVGYSQGGMHAEMLARSGRYNITDVVTLDSPTIPQTNNLYGANILRLHDPWQEPVMILGMENEFKGALAGGLRDVIGGLTGEGGKGIQRTFDGSADVPADGIWGAHTSQEAHRQIAQQFDDSNNAQDLAIKAGIARYQSGTVVADFD